MGLSQSSTSWNRENETWSRNQELGLRETEHVHLDLVDPIDLGRVTLTLPFAAVGPSSLNLQVLERSSLQTRFDTISKRAGDFVVSLVSLVLLSPVMLAIAIAIKLDSPGPVFYRHVRVGLRGNPFEVWKFRSMRTDMPESALEEIKRADERRVDSPVYKSPDDPRITKVGRFIRRTGLDELPQLINVLAGTMSLVGPRPLVTDEVAELDSAQFAYRNSVPPGVTGLWQVFRQLETSFEERIRLDLVYVGCRSIRVDLYLLAMTPIALIKGDRSF